MSKTEVNFKAVVLHDGRVDVHRTRGMVVAECITRYVADDTTTHPGAMADLVEHVRQQAETAAAGS